MYFTSLGTNSTYRAQFFIARGNWPWMSISFKRRWVGNTKRSINLTSTLSVISGWALGEHQEWSKYSNYDVATRVPLMVYVPNVTHVSEPSHATFPFIDVLDNDKQSRNVNDSNQNKHDISENQGFESVELNQMSVSLSKQKVPAKTTALVELVDIFPSLVDLAGLPPLTTCPESSSLKLCTEGHSFAPVIQNATQTLSRQHGHLKQWKTAAFSQYPRPAYYPREDSDKPRLANITLMGYSMRTDKYRYTEWVGFDHHNFIGNWTDLKASELYILDSDPLEDHNQASNPVHMVLVKKLSRMLHQGWRHALPKFSLWFKTCRAWYKNMISPVYW